MNNLPPFDPPYTTTYRTEESTRIVRTLPDGTKQDGVTEEKVQPRRKKSKKQQRAAKQSSPSANHAKNGKPAHLNLIPSNGRAFLYLDVPFHEKDQVKNLGGKWDSAMRKWYIPHGVDVHLFTRWWPETLKQETKMFGQL